MTNNQSETIYDLIIIGSGAAGIGAAVYAGRYRMKVLNISKEFGGETTLAGGIENYPGFKKIDGFDLMMAMKEQAAALRVEFKDGEVTRIIRTEHCFEVIAGQEKFPASAIVLAQGTERRKLGLKREDELRARGVHYCITCDGPLYSGKTIAVIGGGDASVKGVNLAAQYAGKVYLIVRGEDIKAEPVNYEQMKKLGDKVEILLQSRVKELVGEKRLEKIILETAGQERELKLDGLFVEIGALPNVALAKSLGVELDDKGYIQVDNLMRTNIDGVFAAGDTTNHFDRFKQDITAAAMGAVAATSAYEDHQIHGPLCQIHWRLPAVQKV